ncbi:hypothetical protein EPZ47_03435 [Pseudomonas viciae]|uniref:Uncharacterized protein n=1 Tax=Pseudomonas viciae TaxID=2505979 RepID=A0A4P7PCL8_9PSED|nr:hypothetical protein EPZ47_03435 [Pseudomonas viciae]
MLFVGAGLLAKALYQSASMLNDRPLSRASPLPQVFSQALYSRGTCRIAAGALSTQLLAPQTQPGNVHDL